MALVTLTVPDSLDHLPIPKQLHLQVIEAAVVDVERFEGERAGYSF